MKRRIALVFGTRPELVKLAVLAKILSANPSLDLLLVSSGQQRELLAQTLGLFGLRPDHDLDLMTAGQSPAALFSRAVDGISTLAREQKPDWIVVQGDTGTAAAAATAGFYERIPVAHVEAGLRTGDMMSPWPEEFNRRMIGLSATLHFPPTENARINLLREGVEEGRILVTGNTGIDALFWMQEKIRDNAAFSSRWKSLGSKPLILCTFHRREAFGEAMLGIFQAVAELAGSGEAEFILPLHPNPKVQEAAALAFPDPPPGLHLTTPLGYDEFVWLMGKASLILTDSGGVQEEAPSIGKPVIVAREKTERPEAVEAGASVLAGTSKAGVLRQVRRVLQPEVLQAMSHPRPVYGDGLASGRIAEALLNFLSWPL